MRTYLRLLPLAVVVVMVGCGGQELGSGRGSMTMPDAAEGDAAQEEAMEGDAQTGIGMGVADSGMATGPGTGFIGPGGAMEYWGGSCVGCVYYPADAGWALCTGGVWAYTDKNPETVAGCTELGGSADGG
jgi:hypothetical protein